ncbi:MAG: efflux RND transporter periplasmic adaptor subunit [Verrucomicrobia bacterium]|nr:efflux RND transporter periplasmic adaptor subunit [Verrucomicrobiota bacterium]
MKQLGKISFLLFFFLLIGALAYCIFLLQSGKKNEGVITLYGNVDVRQVDIGFRVYGRVDSMPFEEGDFVPKGALMASIDPQPYADQVIKAEAALKASQFSLENAEQIFKRRQELVEIGGVSEEDYENALTARDVDLEKLKEAAASLGVAQTDLNNTKAYCPADGTILTRVREPGTVVLQGEPVYTLSLLSPVWIRAYVPEPLLGVIYPGMEAEVHTDTKNGKVYKGTIGFISPVAEFTPKTVETTQLRTDLVYRIRIYADNPDWCLKQGMPVTVKLHPKQEKKSERPRPYPELKQRVQEPKGSGSD